VNPIFREINTVGMLTVFMLQISWEKNWTEFMLHFGIGIITLTDVMCFLKINLYVYIFIH